MSVSVCTVNGDSRHAHSDVIGQLRAVLDVMFRFGVVDIAHGELPILVVFALSQHAVRDLHLETQALVLADVPALPLEGVFWNRFHVARGAKDIEFEAGGIEIVYV